MMMKLSTELYQPEFSTECTLSNDFSRNYTNTNIIINSGDKWRI